MPPIIHTSAKVSEDLQAKAMAKGRALALAWMVQKGKGGKGKEKAGKGKGSGQPEPVKQVKKEPGVVDGQLPEEVDDHEDK